VIIIERIKPHYQNTQIPWISWRCLCFLIANTLHATSLTHDLLMSSSVHVHLIEQSCVENVFQSTENLKCKCKLKLILISWGL